MYASLALGCPVFGVIWLTWALLLSQPTCSLPAFVALTGGYRSGTVPALSTAGFVGVLVAVAALLSRDGRPTATPTPNPPIWSRRN